MVIAHVTQTGNISIPKQWRDELGIEPNSSVIIEKVNNTVVIEPLRIKSLKESLKEIDKEARRKKISFTREEAIADDLYD